MYSKILVPVAPGYGNEAHEALKAARALLEPGGTIQVLTVFQELPRYLAVEADMTVMERNQRQVEEAITRDFDAPDVEIISRIGHPTRVVLDFAKQGGHDCIVLASHQPGWEHVFLGSTASGVVRHAHCSVHVLRTKSD